MERLGPRLREFGITRVANLTGLDRLGIPVVGVCRPNARSISVAQGKGLTLAAAKVSGLMESIETYHAEHSEVERVFASLAELSRERLIDVEGLPRLPTGQFDDNTRLFWTEGVDLVSVTERLVPLELVHLDFRLPFPRGSGAFLMSSNGLASGNHKLEAIIHGICELTERDANTLWSLSPLHEQHRTRIDSRTVDDASCRALLELMDRSEIDVTIFETTTDIGICSFLCQVADRTPDPSAPVAPSTGSGCHLRREIALARALTEAAQGRLTMISGARDDLGSQAYAPAEVARRLGRFRSLREETAMRSFKDVPSVNHSYLREDLEFLLGRLTRAGFCQVVMLDLTLSRFDIPVVRVIVPGLESISEFPGFIPGPRALQRLALVA